MYVVYAIHSPSAVFLSPFCTGLSPECEEGAVRLVDGISETNGRLEICQGGVWGTVCHDLWDDIDAAVVCNQLNITYTRMYQRRL